MTDADPIRAGALARRAPHILTFAESFDGGGVERAQLRICRQLLDAGHRVTLVVGALRGPLVADVPAGLDLIALGTTNYLLLARAVIAQTRLLDPDLIFCPGNYYTAIAALARLRLGRACPPIVSKISNALRRPDMGRIGDRLHWLWLHAQRPAIDHYVAMSPAMAEEAVAWGGVDPDRLTVIPNPSGPRATTAAVRHDPIRPLVLGVGRLAPQKRWLDLVRAFAALPGHLNARLVILGEGPERAKIERHIRKAGLGGRVELPGHIDDPLRYMRQARVVALCSAFEGRPSVLLEALSVGAPVVATACGAAVEEIANDSRVGALLPVGDVAALSAAIAARLAERRTHDLEGSPRRRMDDCPRAAALYPRLFAYLANRAPAAPDLPPRPAPGDERPSHHIESVAR